MSHCRWDELSDQLVAAADHEKPVHLSTVSDDTWLPHPAHYATTVRPQPGEAADSTFHAFALSEQTLIPLPAAEWSGLVGLAGLALLRARKSLRKIFLQ